MLQVQKIHSQEVQDGVHYFDMFDFNVTIETEAFKQNNLDSLLPDEQQKSIFYQTVNQQYFQQPSQPYERFYQYVSDNYQLISQVLYSPQQLFQFVDNFINELFKDNTNDPQNLYQCYICITEAVPDVFRDLGDQYQQYLLNYINMLQLHKVHINSQLFQCAMQSIIKSIRYTKPSNDILLQIINFIIYFNKTNKIPQQQVNILLEISAHYIRKGNQFIDLFVFNKYQLLEYQCTKDVIQTESVDQSDTSDNQSTNDKENFQMEEVDEDETINQQYVNFNDYQTKQFSQSFTEDDYLTNLLQNIPQIVIQAIRRVNGELHSQTYQLLDQLINGLLAFKVQPRQISSIVCIMCVYLFECRVEESQLIDLLKHLIFNIVLQNKELINNETQLQFNQLFKLISKQYVFYLNKFEKQQDLQNIYNQYIAQTNQQINPETELMFKIHIFLENQQKYQNKNETIYQIIEKFMNSNFDTIKSNSQLLENLFSILEYCCAHRSYQTQSEQIQGIFAQQCMDHFDKQDQNISFQQIQLLEVISNYITINLSNEICILINDVINKNTSNMRFYCIYKLLSNSKYSYQFQFELDNCKQVNEQEQVQKQILSCVLSTSVEYLIDILQINIENPILFMVCSQKLILLMKIHQSGSITQNSKLLNIDFVKQLCNFDGRIRNSTISVVNQIFNENKLVYYLNKLYNVTNVQEIQYLMSQLINEGKAFFQQKQNVEEQEIIAQIFVHGTFGLLYSSYDTIQDSIYQIFDFLCQQQFTIKILNESQLISKLIDYKNICQQNIELQSFQMINLKHYTYDIFQQGVEEVEKLNVRIKNSLNRYNASLMYISNEKILSELQQDKFQQVIEFNKQSELNDLVNYGVVSQNIVELNTYVNISWRQRSFKFQKLIFQPSVQTIFEKISNNYVIKYFSDVLIQIQELSFKIFNQQTHSQMIYQLQYLLGFVKLFSKYSQQYEQKQELADILLELTIHKPFQEILLTIITTYHSLTLTPFAIIITQLCNKNLLAEQLSAINYEEEYYQKGSYLYNEENKNDTFQFDSVESTFTTYTQLQHLYVMKDKITKHNSENLSRFGNKFVLCSFQRKQFNKEITYILINNFLQLQNSSITKQILAFVENKFQKDEKFHFYNLLFYSMCNQILKYNQQQHFQLQLNNYDNYSQILTKQSVFKIMDSLSNILQITKFCLDSQIRNGFLMCFINIISFTMFDLNIINSSQKTNLLLQKSKELQSELDISPFYEQFVEDGERLQQHSIKIFNSVFCILLKKCCQQEDADDDEKQESFDQEINVYEVEQYKQLFNNDINVINQFFDLTIQMLEANQINNVSNMIINNYKFFNLLFGDNVDKFQQLIVSAISHFLNKQIRTKQMHNIMKNIVDLTEKYDNVKQLLTTYIENNQFQRLIKQLEVSIQIIQTCNEVSEYFRQITRFLIIFQIKKQPLDDALFKYIQFNDTEVQQIIINYFKLNYQNNFLEKIESIQTFTQFNVLFECYKEQESDTTKKQVYQIMYVLTLPQNNQNNIQIQVDQIQLIINGTYVQYSNCIINQIVNLFTQNTSYPLQEQVKQLSQLLLCKYINETASQESNQDAKNQIYDITNRLMNCFKNYKNDLIVQEGILQCLHSLIPKNNIYYSQILNSDDNNVVLENIIQLSHQTDYSDIFLFNILFTKYSEMFKIHFSEQHQQNNLLIMLHNKKPFYNLLNYCFKETTIGRFLLLNVTKQQNFLQKILIPILGQNEQRSNNKDNSLTIQLIINMASKCCYQTYFALYQQLVEKQQTQYLIQYVFDQFRFNEILNHVDNENDNQENQLLLRAFNDYTPKQVIQIFKQKYLTKYYQCLTIQTKAKRVQYQNLFQVFCSNNEISQQNVQIFAQILKKCRMELDLKNLVIQLIKRLQDKMYSRRQKCRNILASICLQLGSNYFGLILQNIYSVFDTNNTFNQICSCCVECVVRSVVQIDKQSAINVVCSGTRGDFTQLIKNDTLINKSLIYRDNNDFQKVVVINVLLQQQIQLIYQIITKDLLNRSEQDQKLQKLHLEYNEDKVYDLISLTIMQFQFDNNKNIVQQQFFKQFIEQLMIQAVDYKCDTKKLVHYIFVGLSQNATFSKQQLFNLLFYLNDEQKCKYCQKKPKAINSVYDIKSAILNQTNISASQRTTKLRNAHMLLEKTPQHQHCVTTSSIENQSYYENFCIQLSVMLISHGLNQNFGILINKYPLFNTRLHNYINNKTNKDIFNFDEIVQFESTNCETELNQQEDFATIQQFLDLAVYSNSVDVLLSVYQSINHITNFNQQNQQISQQFIKQTVSQLYKTNNDMLAKLIFQFVLNQLQQQYLLNKEIIQQDEIIKVIQISTLYVKSRQNNLSEPYQVIKLLIQNNFIHSSIYEVCDYFVSYSVNSIVNSGLDQQSQQIMIDCIVLYVNQYKLSQQLKQEKIQILVKLSVEAELNEVKILSLKCLKLICQSIDQNTFVNLIDQIMFSLLAGDINCKGSSQEKQQLKQQLQLTFQVIQANENTKENLLIKYFSQFMQLINNQEQNISKQQIICIQVISFVTGMWQNSQQKEIKQFYDKFNEIILNKLNIILTKLDANKEQLNFQNEDITKIETKFVDSCIECMIVFNYNQLENSNNIVNQYILKYQNILFYENINLLLRERIYSYFTQTINISSDIILNQLQTQNQLTLIKDYQRNMFTNLDIHQISDHKNIAYFYCFVNLSNRLDLNELVYFFNDLLIKYISQYYQHIDKINEFFMYYLQYLQQHQQEYESIIHLLIKLSYKLQRFKHNINKHVTTAVNQSGLQLMSYIKKYCKNKELFERVKEEIKEKLAQQKSQQQK